MGDRAYDLPLDRPRELRFSAATCTDGLALADVHAYLLNRDLKAILRNELPAPWLMDTLLVNRRVLSRSRERLWMLAPEPLQELIVRALT